jgi:hypothetical protein
VNNFSTGNQNILDSYNVVKDMPLARLMQNKDLADTYKDVTQGAENAQKIEAARIKPLDELTNQRNLSNFQTSTAMLNTPSERTGQMMPYGEAAALIQQAAADYPVKPDVVNQTTDNLLKQYDTIDNPFKNNDEASLTRKALSGDKEAQAILTAMQRRKVETAIASRPPAAAGRSRVPVGYRFTQEGDLEVIPGGPADGDRPRSGKILTAGALESLANQSLIAKTLEAAKVMADEKDKNGNYTVDSGPVSGRAQSLLELGGKASPKFVDYKQKLATVTNIMLKERSGAAVTEQEYARFLKEMPDENTPIATRGTKLNNAIKYMNTLAEEKKNTYRAGGYRVPGDAGQRATPDVKPPSPQSAAAELARRRGGK